MRKRILPWLVLVACLTVPTATPAADRHAIARIWKGRTLAAKADEYEKYLNTGIAKLLAIPGNLGVQVDPAGAELLVGRVDVIRRQADPGLHRGRVSFAGGCQRDPRRAARRVDLDPAVLIAERDVGPLLEPERLGVELDRLVLVGRGDDFRGASTVRDRVGYPRALDAAVGATPR